MPRKSQGFIVELDDMIGRYKTLLEKYEIEHLLPVYTLDSDWDRKNELMDRGFTPKTFEPQCLLGFPLDGPIGQNIIDGVHAYYDKVVLPRIEDRKLIYRPFDQNNFKEIFVYNEK